MARRGGSGFESGRGLQTSAGCGGGGAPKFPFIQSHERILWRGRLLDDAGENQGGGSGSKKRGAVGGRDER